MKPLPALFLSFSNLVIKRNGCNDTCYRRVSYRSAENAEFYLYNAMMVNFYLRSNFTLLSGTSAIGYL
jgi:hypothetical protein